jgi:hypothetical protein
MRLQCVSSKTDSALVASMMLWSWRRVALPAFCPMCLCVKVAWLLVDMTVTSSLHDKCTVSLSAEEGLANSRHDGQWQATAKCETPPPNFGWLNVWLLQASRSTRS